MTRRLFKDMERAEHILQMVRGNDRDQINGKEYSEDFHFRYGDAGWSTLKVTTKLLIGSEESRKNPSAPSAIREDDREAAFEAVAGLNMEGSIGWGTHDFETLLTNITKVAGMVLADFIRTLNRYAPAVYSRLPHRESKHLRILLGRPFGADQSIKAYVSDQERYLGEPASESLDHVLSSTGSYSRVEGQTWTAHMYTPGIICAVPKGTLSSDWTPPFLWTKEQWTAHGKSITPEMRVDMANLASWFRTLLHELTHKLTGDWVRAPKLFVEGLCEYVIWKIASVRLEELERIPADLTSAQGDEVLLSPALRLQLKAVYSHVLQEGTNDYGPLLAYWKDWERIQPWFGMEVVARGRAYVKTFEPGEEDRTAGRVHVVKFVRRILTLKGDFEYKELPAFAPLQSKRYAFDEKTSLVIGHATALEEAAEKAIGVQSVLKEVLRAFLDTMQQSRNGLKSRYELMQERAALLQIQVKSGGAREGFHEHDTMQWARSVAEAETMSLVAEHIFVPLAKFQNLLSDYGGDISKVPAKDLRKVMDLLGDAAPAFAELLRTTVGELAQKAVIADPGADAGADKEPVNDYTVFFDHVKALEALKPADAATVYVSAFIDALSAYLLIPRYKAAQLNLQTAGKQATEYVSGKETVHAASQIGRGQDALQMLGSSDEGGFLKPELWDAYSHAFAEATTKYLSGRSFDQRLADDLERLSSIEDGRDWYMAIKRLGETLAAHFRTLPPSKPRQVVASARGAFGAFNMSASSKRFLSYGLDPAHIMVTTFKPLLRTVHLATLLDLSWSMKGSTVSNEAQRMGTIYMLGRDAKRALTQGGNIYNTPSIKRVSLGITMAAATIAGVLKDSKSVTSVFFAETARVIPVTDVDDFLIRARFIEQKYVQAYMHGQQTLQSYRKYIEERLSPGAFDKARAKRMRELKKDRSWSDDKDEKIRIDITAWEKQWRKEVERLQEAQEKAVKQSLAAYKMPEDLERLFDIEGEGARLDLALRELEATGFYGRKGTKLVFIFTDGSPEAGDRNPLQDAPIQAEVIRQLTTYRNEAIFVFVFITPEDTEYQEVLDGKSMEYPDNEKHVGATQDVLMYRGSVGAGADARKVEAVHYAKPPYYPKMPDEAHAALPFDGPRDVPTYYEKVLGLRPVKFRVMSTPEWIRRLELGKVITVNLKAYEDFKTEGRQTGRTGVDIERAFGDFTLAVDRAVREAVAMRMV